MKKIKQILIHESEFFCTFVLLNSWFDPFNILMLMISSMMFSFISQIFLDSWDPCEEQKHV